MLEAGASCRRAKVDIHRERVNPHNSPGHGRSQGTHIDRGALSQSVSSEKFFERA